MFRLLDDRVLAPGVRERRLLARTVIRMAEPAGLLVFSNADTHTHMVLDCDRARAGKLAHDLCCALHFSVEPGQHFERTRIKPVQSQQHLDNVVRYVLRQRTHHGLQVDPLGEGTSLPDLLGLRVLASRSPHRVHELLPRLRREELVALLGPEGLEPAQIIPGDLAELEAACEGAAAALGLLDLAGQDSRTRLAKAAVLQLSNDPALVAELRGSLQVSRTTSWRLRTMSVPAPLERALALQIAHRRWLRGQATVGSTSFG